jgi:lipopolysaccharide exporter
LTAAASLFHRTAIGAAWMVAWRMVTRTLGLASTLVLARILLPADFGLLAMATTFSAAVEALSQIGVQDALIRHPNSERLLDTGFTLQLGRGIATGLVVALAAPGAAAWFIEPRLIPLLLILAGCAVVAGTENIGIIAFRRDMRFERQFLLLSGPRLLQAAITIPLALLLQSYWALVAGIVVSRLVRTAMTYVLHSYRPKLSLTGWRELGQFSFWTWVSALAGLVWDRCDPFVLGPELGAGFLGLYVQSVELATLPTTELVIPAADALLAGFSVSQRQGRSTAALAPTAALVLMTAIFPLVITVSCGAGDIVAVLLGQNWARAQDLVAILAWQGVVAPFGFVIGVTLVAHGLVRRNFIANSIAAAIKLTGLTVTVMLTRRLDIIAWVIVGCVSCEAVVFYGLLPRDARGSLRQLLAGLTRASLAAAAAMWVLWELGLAWRGQSAWGLPALADGLLIGLVTLFVYFAALLGAWLAVGRPPGPEQRLLSLAAASTATLRARLR